MSDEIGTFNPVDTSEATLFNESSHFESLQFDSGPKTDGVYEQSNSSHRASDGDQAGLMAYDDTLADDVISFFQSNLAPHKLLTKKEEQELGYRMVDVCHRIIEACLSQKNSAEDFTRILHVIIHNPLKVKMFCHSKAYFCLRQEFQDIVKEEKSGNQISQFIQAVNNCILIQNTHTQLIVSVELRQLIEKINWPYPLIVMISNRYCSGSSSNSLLRTAFYTFLKTVKFSPQHLSQKVLNKQQSNRLNQLNKQYFSIRDTFVVRNLPLVFNIAQRYSVIRTDLMELIQEGAMGLIRAAEKYRIKTGNRFSTYAYTWIESKVRFAKVNVNNLIPISPEINRELAKLHGLIDEAKRAGRNDSVEIIAKKLHLKEERVSFLMTLNRHFLSLDYNCVDGDERDLHSFYADEESILSHKLESKDVKKKLFGIMQRLLNEREAYIVSERFGLIDSMPKTIQVVADIVGISRERVRQIEAGALTKLREFMSTSEDGTEFYQFLSDVHP